MKWKIERGKKRRSESTILRTDRVKETFWDKSEDFFWTGRRAIPFFSISLKKKKEKKERREERKERLRQRVNPILEKIIKSAFDAWYMIRCMTFVWRGLVHVRPAHFSDSSIVFHISFSPLRLLLSSQMFSYLSLSLLLTFFSFFLYYVINLFLY